jgi:pSer/pThr/pTyr-binding forkhead associated (FHA) protein
MRRTAIVMRADTDETLDLTDPSAAATPRTSFSLRVISGPDAGAVVQLDPSGPPNTVVGQASSCALKLTDRHVSRRHVALTVTTTHVLLADMGSTNGTLVNGVRIREAKLYGGEKVQLGRTVFVIESDADRPSEVRAIADDVPPARSSSDDLIASAIDEQLSFPKARERVLAEFERRYIEEVLARHGGNVTRAARASGIAHRYFQLVRARTRGE